MLMADGTVGLYIKEKKLTKHICQPGKPSLQTGILPAVWLLSTSLPLDALKLNLRLKSSLISSFTCLMFWGSMSTIYFKTSRILSSFCKRKAQQIMTSGVI